MTPEGQVTMLVGAIASLATAIGILWRSLERRTDAQVAIATESIKTMVALQTQVASVDQHVQSMALERATQLNRISDQIDQGFTNVERTHVEQVVLLRELRAAVLERQRLGVFETLKAVLPGGGGGSGSNSTPSAGEAPGD